MLGQYHFNSVVALETQIFCFFILLWNRIFLAELLIYVLCLRTTAVCHCMSYYVMVSINTFWVELSWVELKNHETSLWVPIQSPEPSSAKYVKYLSWSLSLFNPYIHLDIHLNSDGSLRLFTCSLRPRQMAAISEMTFSRAIFLNENLWILDKISL